MRLYINTAVQQVQRGARISRLVIAPMVVASLLGGSVAAEQPKPEQKMPAAFVVLPGANNVTRHELEGGRQQLTYRVDADYPAQNVIDAITRTLRQRGWSPLQHDYFNRGESSSLVRGWDYYVDEATQPKTSVRYWQVDWRRQREIVTYRLEYRCPDDSCASTRDLHDLRVITIYAKDADKAYHR